MRKFYIQANNGLIYDLQNRTKCFLNNPSGLGFEMDNDYVEVGDYFNIDDSKKSQKTISGELIFVNDWYANFKEFITFIKSYSDYKLVYKYDDNTYYIDIDIISVDKGDTKGNKYLSCNIQMKSKSLWYKVNSINLTAESTTNLAAWDFTFDLQFNDVIFDNILITNAGQVETPFEIELTGSFEKPKMVIIRNNEIYKELEFSTETTSASDKLLYGNKDNNLYAKKIINDEEQNAINDLDLANDNWFKIPIGDSTIRFECSSGNFTKVKLTYYEEFEAI